MQLVHAKSALQLHLARKLLILKSMFNKNQAPEADIHATLTCPVCESKQKVVMPLDQFQHYYKCTNNECLADLAPAQGKDCVFCSYADKPCPQRQLNPNINEHKLQSLI